MKENKAKTRALEKTRIITQSFCLHIKLFLSSYEVMFCLHMKLCFVFALSYIFVFILSYVFVFTLSFVFTGKNIFRRNVAVAVDYKGALHYQIFFTIHNAWKTFMKLMLLSSIVYLIYKRDVL